LSRITIPLSVKPREASRATLNRWFEIEIGARNGSI
jgi:hypothetical protein